MTLLLALLLILTQSCTPTTYVPDVLLLHVDDATEMIEEAGLVADPLCIEEPGETPFEPGTVGVTDPLPGTKVLRGSSVLMVVVGPCADAAPGGGS